MRSSSSGAACILVQAEEKGECFGVYVHVLQELGSALSIRVERYLI